MITNEELTELRQLWQEHDDECGCNLVPKDDMFRLLDEIARLRAVLLNYAEEYEGCEDAREALGMKPWCYQCGSTCDHVYPVTRAEV